MLNNSFKNKKILIFGNTGFKGSWLTIALLNLGAEIYGVSLNIPTSPSLFKEAQLKSKIKFIQLDIRNKNKVKSIVNKIQPDFMFHLAAQSIVLNSILDPTFTFETNSIGTMNILDSLRDYKKKIAVVIVTSDKCYENVEKKIPYKELDRLGGKDPYSASKACAEIIFKSYVDSFLAKKKNIRVSTARAGNVIGGGDWSKFRLVPDCMISAHKKRKIEIRSPNSTRPWQHVLEPIFGYLLLSDQLYKNIQKINNDSFNFGPNKFSNITVKNLIKKMMNQWEDINPKYFYTRKSIESNLLQLDTKKSKKLLGWTSILNLDQTIKFTVDWYKFFYNNKNKSIFDYTVYQIQEYLKLFNKKK
jgi:CDP-glucose 4,6-dehydratase